MTFEPFESAATFLLPAGVGPWGAAILVLASFFTSALTIAAGIGGGLMLLALMTYLVPIAALVPVHGAVQLGSNLGRAALLRMHIAWPCLLAFLAGAVPGAWLGGFAVGLVGESALRLMLGLFILILAWVPVPRLAAISLPGFALTGAVTSFLTMIVGATGPFNAAVLSKTFDSRLKLAATLASAMSAQHMLKILFFALAGFTFWQWIPLILAMALTGLMGTWAGRFVLLRTSESRFRLAFKICLSLLALELMRKSVAGMSLG